MDQKTQIEELAIKPTIRVGTDNFQTLLLKSNVFVDKSLLIKEIIEDSGDVILITRPRRWGKSLNMDMIQRFLEIETDKKGNKLPQDQRLNHKLFLGGQVDLGFADGSTELLKKLKIANHPNIISKYLGQFPVIKINFKDVRGNSYKEIVNLKSFLDGSFGLSIWDHHIQYLYLLPPIAFKRSGRFCRSKYSSCNPKCVSKPAKPCKLIS